MPKFLQVVLQAFGVALVLSGGLWTLQGLGLVMWPEESFMLAQRQWALYGSLTVAAGLLLVWLGRKRN
ncbi:MAG: hypothetical protein PHE36_02350 [Novosphingobium sp.]|nr:hypothetical protein [Novosphingobium sp.]